MFSRFKLEKSLVGLLLITAIAIVGERYILQTSLVIDQSSRFGAAVYDDRVTGGASVGQLIANPDALEWHCSLKSKAAYPYCGFELILDPVRQNGIDMSRFNRVKLWLDYEGDAETARFYLRNFDHAYSVPGQNDTTKYNQVEFSSDMLDGLVEFQLKDFFVANWWAQAHTIPPELAHPEFDNIVVLDISVGTSTTSGEHHFTLHRIEFTGQALPTEQWYQLIVAVWILFALVFLLCRLAQLRREVEQRRKREQELMEITEFLDMRGKALEEMSKTDPLTGAFNRDGVEEALQLSLRDWRQDRKPMTLLIMDIDHFKQINDTYGHATGDKVLSELSKLIRSNVRDTDMFARWGGEEFVLVCRNTPVPDGEALAEKLRKRVADHKFGKHLDVTISIGVASLESRESLDQLFSRADEALYKAKGNGRNRTISAGAA